MQQLQTRRQLPGACAFRARARARAWSPSPSLLLSLLSFSPPPRPRPLPLHPPHPPPATLFPRESRRESRARSRGGSHLSRSAARALFPPPSQPYPTCAPSRDTLAARAKYFSSPSQSAARRARVCPRREPSGHSASVRRISSYASVLFLFAGKVDLPRSRGSREVARRGKSRAEI
jgi:hypothetical protein